MAKHCETITRKHAQLRAAQVAVHHYQLHVDVTDDAEFRVDTVVNFSAYPDAVGATTTIDLLDHRVGSAILNGSDVTYDGARLTLPNLQAENELVVSSSAPYSTTGEGLHRYVDPFDEAEYLYSQCEPADARRIFPVFEQPDLKATFELHVKAPAHWVVISNEPGEFEIDGDIAHWRFETTPVMSSYLFALIAGEYTQVTQGWSGAASSVPLGIWARKSMAVYVDADEILEVTRAGFAFYEQQFGVDYPFSKYDQIFVPEFNAGAMENIGAVTITEDYIFRSAVPEAMVQRRAITILHELAHMWFGNLVTMRWWDDLWLNESFAEFVSHLAAIDAGYGDAWTTFNATEKTWAYRQDQLATTHPVIADMVDLDAVAVNFDGITYAKGASVLRQLVAWVGTENFMAGVRAYFVEHAWSNTEFSDLLRHLEAASGRELSGWADQWLHSTGVNTLTWQRSDHGVVITQSQPVRQHRVGIGFYDDVDGQLRPTRSEELDLHSHVTTVSGDHDAQLIVVNDRDLTYAKLRPDATSLQTLTERLDTIADSLTRSLLWGAAWDMTRDGETSAAWFLDLLLTHVGAERDSSVVFSLLRQATTSLNSFVPAAQRFDLRQRFASGLWSLAEHAESGSDIQLQLVQSYIRHARHPETVAQLAQKRGLEGFSVSTDMAWSALQRLVALGEAGEAEIAASLAEDDSSTGHLAAAQARAMLPSAEAKARAWEHITSGELTNLELRHMVMGFVDVHDLDLLTPYVDAYFESIDTLWATSSFETAETLALGLFPMWAASETIAHRTEALANSTSHTGLARILTELHDDVLRALAAQAAF